MARDDRGDRPDLDRGSAEQGHDDVAVDDAITGFRDAVPEVELIEADEAGEAEQRDAVRPQEDAPHRAGKVLPHVLRPQCDLVGDRHPFPIHLALEADRKSALPL